MNVPMKAMRLSRARDSFLFDNKAAGFKPETLRGYRDTLNSFIDFTGDLLVGDLAPDHVRRYVADLAIRPGQHTELISRAVLKHYGVIRTWVRWMYAQRILADRLTKYKPPRLSTRPPSKLTDDRPEDVRGSGRFRAYTDLSSSGRYSGRPCVGYSLPKTWSTSALIFSSATLAEMNCRVASISFRMF